MTIEFQPWGKTSRYFRPITITEKIDGSNAAIQIHPVGPDAEQPNNGMKINVDGQDYIIGAQSRKRVITPAQDNFGFAGWVASRADALVLDLGPGIHFGEWWGKGIQRGYNLDHRLFSLFNTSKWQEVEFQTPELRVVPVMYEGEHDVDMIQECLYSLEEYGSYAAELEGKNFGNAEGVCIFHKHSNKIFKVTLHGDQEKGS